MADQAYTSRPSPEAYEGRDGDDKVKSYGSSIRPAAADPRGQNRTRTTIEHFIGEVNGAAMALREETSMLGEKLEPLMSGSAPTKETPMLDAPSELTNALAQVHYVLEQTREMVRQYAERL